MSGTSMELKYTDGSSPIIKAMQGLLAAGRKTLPLMRQLGEYLVNSTQDRFDTQQAPDGTPWHISDARMLVKRIKKILTESSRLRDSIIPAATATSIEWGTNVIYAAPHQFGKITKPHDIRPKHGQALFFPGLSHPVRLVHHPGSNIPANPYLGISATDEQEILLRVNDYYQAALST